MEFKTSKIAEVKCFSQEIKWLAEKIADIEKLIPEGKEVDKILIYPRFKDRVAFEIEFDGDMSNNYDQYYQIRTETRPKIG